ncbi:MAG: hypothetical protein Q9174_007488 [Haloplaca sp. 1 TL-2023]
MSRLRVFKYYHHNLEADNREFWDAAGMLRYLIDCVASTLEELSLTSKQLSAAPLTSFVGLKKLRKLEVSIHLLHNMKQNHNHLGDTDPLQKNGGEVVDMDPPAPRLVPKLVDIVPAPIKSMNLIWNRHGPVSLALFDGFSELQKEEMPVLRKVTFTFDRYNFPTDDFQHIAHLFSNTHVELDVKAPKSGGLTRPYLRWDVAHLYHKHT